MKLKAAALALFLALATALSGCSFAGLDAQTLMHAPRPTGDNEADIQTLLESAGSGDMTLKYPNSGDCRSAIITHNLCGDKNSEAMAFYEKGDDAVGISVMFMTKDPKGDKWKSMGSFTNPASQVDRVCFGDLDGDGTDEVIVGWGSGANNTGSICVYYYKNGKINELKLNQSYTEMAVMDFDGDGKDEIFTANITQGDQPAAARLIRIRNGSIELMGTAPLDAGVTKYASVKTGLVNEKQVGIVLDGAKAANSMVTELLYWDKKSKTLKAPFYVPAAKGAKNTERSTSVVSRDINGDKIIEIPIVTQMPGYSGAVVDEAAFLTTWQRYETETNTFVRVMSMVIDYSDGYWFSIPDLWRGKTTTKTDVPSRTLTFYEWIAGPKGTAGKIAAPLLKIQAFTQKEWQAGTETKGFFQLGASEDMVFAAKLPSPDEPLSMTEEEVRNSFQLITQE
jgi:hypothetical protein